jgi:hypothetical protein
MLWCVPRETVVPAHIKQSDFNHSKSIIDRVRRDETTLVWQCKENKQEHEEWNLNRVQRNKLVRPGTGRHHEERMGLQRNQREKTVRRQRGRGC